ncbi:class I SAM-dependent methyltransferase [Hahella sp. NBU794]|uniref:SAM-dependent methyltransferase n=1 Tax=Hahella sp. NBU794 TaxID=3422590 RepID=UPI003D6F260A
MSMIELAEKGWLPDALIRFGIRRLCRERLLQERKRGGGELERIARYLNGPIAIETRAANEQHYEVPAEFYRLVLGPRLKYSACWWGKEVGDLAEAEEAMLALYAERAQLADGQRILDLGCGWGSLSLWLAETFPKAEITGVSNSASQRSYIEEQAALRGLRNLKILTCDVNVFSPSTTFDRIVSVEMLEHVRNYQALFERVSQWLAPAGLFFAHIFCHRNLLYPFETEGANNWMGRYFFTGGLMPAAGTFGHFQQNLRLMQQWMLNGRHYGATAEAWLANLDANEAKVRKIFADAYGDEQADLWTQRWRMFFMACAELFNYRSGAEWQVGHYLFMKQ